MGCSLVPFFFFYRGVVNLSDAYSTVLALVAQAGLEGTFSNGFLTSFAPNNAAITALPADTVPF
jgi:uncharacterized surface protein with fasciclin (FAS1) repeats